MSYFGSYFGDAPVSIGSGQIISITEGSLERWTPIVAIVDLDSAELFIHFVSGGIRFVLYDATAALGEEWIESFRDRSTYTDNGDGTVTVSILPNGGWHNASIDIKFVAGAELAT